jgi:trimethylamine:corrinoid methyltransferase-like protein
MAEIAQRPIWMLAMLVNNPMRFDDRVLEFVIDNKDCQQFAIEMVGGLPAIGSTSPMSFPAAHVQGMAEDLAAAFFMHTITGEYPPPYLRGDPFDMKYANYRIGGPEYILLDMANRRLHEYITHTPRSWGYLLSMAKWPDQQATFERTIGCWNQAMNGATFFKGSGQLSSDEIFSVEQVVIDREIVKSAEHVCKGLHFDSDFAQVPNIIQEGLEEGHYLMHETTLNSFRDFFYDTKLFGGTNLGQWRAGGEKTVLEQAHEIVQSVRNNHTFVLENDARIALQVVCKRAEEILL